MAITAQMRKLLWVRSGNEWAFPGCPQVLTLSGDSPESVVLGEEAHIVAKAPDGSRGGSAIPGGDVDGVANLVLLCPTHHRLVDEQPSVYPVPALREIKEAHEQRVRERAEPDEVARSLGEEEAAGMCEGLRTFGAWRIGETLLVVCLMGSDPIRVSSNAWRGTGVILKAINVRTGIKVLGEYSEADPDVMFSLENELLRVVEWSFDVERGEFVPFVEHRHNLGRPDTPSTTVRIATHNDDGNFTAEDIVEEYHRAAAAGKNPEAIVLRFRKTGLANPTAVIDALTSLRVEANFDGALSEAASMVYRNCKSIGMQVLLRVRKANLTRRLT